LSADGHWVATGSSDGTARVNLALDGRETLRHSNDEQREAAAVAFSPSGQSHRERHFSRERTPGGAVPTPAGVKPDGGERMISLRRSATRRSPPGRAAEFVSLI
jgi:hypothetical protein